jgi:hypothetical protein
MELFLSILYIHMHIYTNIFEASDDRHSANRPKLSVPQWANEAGEGHTAIVGSIGFSVSNMTYYGP